MGAVRRYWDIFKLVFLYIKFKYRQYRLKTNETMLVKTTYGPIRGVKRFSCWNDPFYSFEKVPFAKPPLGELRFKAPVPPDPWTEVKDCTKEGPNPLQTNLLVGRMEGSEDCLYLNVYTKSLHPPHPVPVMVWIYGGGFETGGTTKDFYSPDYFMQRDIVLVSITYRVGPFGFLSFKDPSLNIPGNAGLKDQLLGLKWVKENCSLFGGDPNNITLFGESAGAASCHYLMLAERAKGLFHRAILMSGSVLTPWARIALENMPQRLARQAGYMGNNSDKDLYEFYKNADGSSLVYAERKIITREERKNCILMPVAPCIEPYITEDCVIPEDPMLMMRKAWSNEIPILIGGTTDEGYLMHPFAKRYPQLFNATEDFSYFVPLELDIDRHGEKASELGLRIKNAHYGDKPVAATTKKEFYDLYGFKLFWHGIHRTILSRLQYASAPTYLYRFDCDSPTFNHMRIFWCGPNKRGTCHADDLSYMFYNAVSEDVPKDSMEYRAIQVMMTILETFAKTGNPNHNSLGATWSPVNKDEKPITCFNISEKNEVIELPGQEKLEVWDSLYPLGTLI